MGWGFGLGVEGSMDGFVYTDVVDSWSFVFWMFGGFWSLFVIYV